MDSNSHPVWGDVIKLQKCCISDLICNDFLLVYATLSTAPACFEGVEPGFYRIFDDSYKFLGKYIMAIALKGQERTLKGKKVKSLRRKGIVPAEVYGKGEENVSVQFDERELAKTVTEAGTTQIIDLDVNGKQLSVLVKDVVRSLDRKSIVHIDLYAVNADIAVKAVVPVKVVGESPLVAKGGVLVAGADQVEVSCLPKAIPQLLKVDASKLLDFSDILSVSDIEAPEGVEILTNGGTMVAYISHTRATRSAAPAAAAEAAAEGAEEAPEADAAEESAESAE